jgi:hypothetical protein
MIDFSKLEQAQEPEKPKKEDSLKLKNYICIIFTSESEPREKAIVLDCEYNRRIVFEIEYNKSKKEKYIELIKTNYTKITFKEDDYGKFKQETRESEELNRGLSESVETVEREQGDSGSERGEIDNRPNDDSGEHEGRKDVWCCIY